MAFHRVRPPRRHLVTHAEAEAIRNAPTPQPEPTPAIDWTTRPLPGGMLGRLVREILEEEQS